MQLACSHPNRPSFSTSLFALLYRLLQYFCPLFRSYDCGFQNPSLFRQPKPGLAGSQHSHLFWSSACPLFWPATPSSSLSSDLHLFPLFRLSAMPSVLIFDICSHPQHPLLFCLCSSVLTFHTSLFSDPQSPYYPDFQLSDPFCTSALSCVFSAPLRYGHSTPLCSDPPKPPLLWPSTPAPLALTLSPTPLFWSSTPTSVLVLSTINTHYPILTSNIPFCSGSQRPPLVSTSKHPPFWPSSLPRFELQNLPLFWSPHPSLLTFSTMICSDLT